MTLRRRKDEETEEETAVEKKKKKGPGLIEGLLGGIIFTLILVVLIPVICEQFIQSYVEEFIGSATFLGLTSNTLISLAMWAIIMGFTLLFGGGGVLRRYGFMGVVGLVVAYALLGDVRAAAIPVITLSLMYALLLIFHRIRRGGSDDDDGAPAE